MKEMVLAVVCLLITTDTEFCPGYSSWSAWKPPALGWGEAGAFLGASPGHGQAAQLGSSGVGTRASHRLGLGAALVWWTLQGSGSTFSRLLTAETLGRDLVMCCHVTGGTSAVIRIIGCSW